MEREVGQGRQPLRLSLLKGSAWKSNGGSSGYIVRVEGGVWGRDLIQSTQLLIEVEWNWSPVCLYLGSEGSTRTHGFGLRFEVGRVLGYQQHLMTCPNLHFMHLIM